MGGWGLERGGPSRRNYSASTAARGGDVLYAVWLCVCCVVQNDVMDGEDGV